MPQAKPAVPLQLDVTLNTAHLLRAIGRTSRAVVQTTIPAMSCLALSAAAETGVQVAGVSQDQAITTWIGGEIRVPGGVLLPAKGLYDLVGTWPAGSQVRLSLPENSTNLTISGPGFNLTLQLGPTIDEFPQVPVASTENALEFAKASEIVQLLEQVYHVAAKDNSHPILNGVHFLASSGWLTLEATDGLRLHQVKVKLPAAKEVNLVVPATAIRHAVDLLDPNEPAHLVFHEKDGAISRVVFVQEMLQLLANTLEGKFPDLAAVIPAQSNVSASLSTKHLLACLARADKMADSHSVRLAITPHQGVTPGKVVFTATEKERGKHTEALTATCSAALEIAVNGSFLADMVTAHAIAGGNGQAQLLMTNASSPVVLRNGTFVGAVMPMALRK